MKYSMTSNQKPQGLCFRIFRFVFRLLIFCVAVGLGIYSGYQLGYLFPYFFPDAFSYLTMGTLGIAIFISLKSHRIEKDRQLASSFYYLVFIGFLSSLIFASSLSSPLISRITIGDRIAGFIPYNDAVS